MGAAVIPLVAAVAVPLVQKLLSGGDDSPSTKGGTPVDLDSYVKNVALSQGADITKGEMPAPAGAPTTLIGGQPYQPPGGYDWNTAHALQRAGLTTDQGHALDKADFRGLSFIPQAMAAKQAAADNAAHKGEPAASDIGSTSQALSTKAVTPSQGGVRGGTGGQSGSQAPAGVGPNGRPYAPSGQRGYDRSNEALTAQVTHPQTAPQMSPEQEAAARAAMERYSPEAVGFNHDVADADAQQLGVLAGQVANRQIVKNIADPTHSQYEPDQRALIARLSDPNYQSAAALQQQRGLGDAQAGNFALAAARPGALGMRQAILNNSAMAQRQINTAGQLRANEEAARNGLLSSSLGTFRGQDLDLNQQILNTGMANNQASIAQTGLNDTALHALISKQIDLHGQNKDDESHYWDRIAGMSGAAAANNSTAATNARYEQDRADNMRDKIAQGVASGVGMIKPTTPATTTPTTSTDPSVIAPGPGF